MHVVDVADKNNCDFVPKKPEIGQKNVFVAYLLWLVGGVWGFHHFYLGRYRHALVWYCTDMLLNTILVRSSISVCAQCVPEICLRILNILLAKGVMLCLREHYNLTSPLHAH